MLNRLSKMLDSKAHSMNHARASQITKTGSRRSGHAVLTGGETVEFRRIEGGVDELEPSFAFLSSLEERR